jgi:hypothetical protein
LAFYYEQTVFADGTIDEETKDEYTYLLRLNRVFSPKFNVYGELRAETLDSDSELDLDYDSHFVVLGLEYTFE